MHPVKSLLLIVPFRYLMGPFLLLLVLIGLPLFAWQVDIAGRQIQSLYREVQLENTRWQRYLNLLSNAPMQQFANSGSRTALEVALREAAQSLQIQPEVQIDAFTVVPTETLDVDDDLGSSIEPIRIGFEATLLHAPALLEIFGRLATVAGWRVMEVRGCAMQRLASEPRLATACTIDIYHWSWTDNINMETN
ncbi:MAG: hypothetical protein V3U65_19050 [Granulosicoccaceae bacterium]